jgi:hypothetical protein
MAHGVVYNYMLPGEFATYMAPVERDTDITPVELDKNQTASRWIAEDFLLRSPQPSIEMLSVSCLALVAFDEPDIPNTE